MAMCLSLAILIAVVHPYNKRNDIFNRFDPLMIFFLVIWLMVFRNLRQLAGGDYSAQHSRKCLNTMAMAAALLLAYACPIRHCCICVERSVLTVSLLYTCMIV